MKSWDLRAIDAEPHEPRILSSAEDARAILLHLPAGERLQEHEVHEHARRAASGCDGVLNKSALVLPVRLTQQSAPAEQAHPAGAESG